VKSSPAYVKTPPKVITLKHRLLEIYKKHTAGGGCVFFCVYVDDVGSAVGWLLPPERALAQTGSGRGR
jgi:hypothetical protein